MKNFLAVPSRFGSEIKGKLAWLGTKLVETEDGQIYADSAYRSAEAEAMLAQKQVTSHIHERAYRNRPLTDEQKESNRQKSKIRARIEHVFGYMSQSMKGF